MVPALALRNVPTQLHDELGAPASSVWNALDGRRPVGVIAYGPRMSTESSVTTLWYSLQYS